METHKREYFTGDLLTIIRIARNTVIKELVFPKQFLETALLIPKLKENLPPTLPFSLKKQALDICAQRWFLAVKPDFWGHSKPGEQDGLLQNPRPLDMLGPLEKIPTTNPAHFPSFGWMLIKSEYELIDHGAFARANLPRFVKTLAN